MSRTYDTEIRLYGAGVLPRSVSAVDYQLDEVSRTDRDVSNSNTWLPVMNELASLSKNKAAPLNSCGWAILPRKFASSHCFRRVGSSSKFFRTMGVMMFPGKYKYLDV
jgi:hypothetical protein